MKIHIFIDAENVPATNALVTCNVLAEDNEITRCDVVGKEDILSPAYLKRRSKKFRIHNCNYGKNSADMCLTVIIAKAIYEEHDTDIFAIISNDRDFAPVIQLAVEKRRQVLLLGMAEQLKALEQSLKLMKIDMNFVTLGVIDGEMLSESIKVADLPNGLREYFEKNHTGSTIFVKRGDKLIELPFIDGMHANIFLDLMRRCHIWTRAQKIQDEIGSLYLKVVDNKVRFVDSIDELPNEVPKLELMPDDLKDFYQSQYEGGKIYVRYNDKQVELPFVNGMHLGRMIQLMRHFQIWPRNQKLKATVAKLKELGLVLKNDYVFYGD